ncbi:hypothetical protein F4823DRAFT_383066 [Ustulina deusta]|nr:hypothetical protein F4823DRAFT_383066 [Ustulina deusta]
MSWRVVPTIENHIKLHTPDLSSEHEEWEWPFSKFGFPNPNVLFNDLHSEYNSIRCAIQDPYGWYFDVCEIAKLADNREQFLGLLRKRQDERFAELQKSWHKITTLLIAEPDRWDTPRKSSDLWMRFIRISRNFSYDTFIAYFGAYVKDQAEPSTSKTPIEPELSGEFKRQQEQMRLEIEGQANTVETRPENPRVRSSPDSTLEFRMQQGEIGLDIEEHASIGDTWPERTRPKPDRIDRATQTTAPRTRRTAAAKRQSGQAAESLNKVVKRQTRRSKPATRNPQGLRRSARLQERAARGS